MLKQSEAFSSFSVDDLDAARDFYGGMLGMEVEVAGMGLDIKISGGAHVFAYPKPNHEPATFTILNFAVPDLEAAVDELAAAGIKMEQYDFGDWKTDEKGIARGDSMGGGPDVAWFTDPARNIIAVMQQ